MNQITPYDTGKVKIGCRFERDTRPALSSFDEKLQEALIGNPDRHPIERWLDENPRVAPVAVFAGLVLAMTIAGSFQ